MDPNEEVKEHVFVTFVLPNLSDSSQLRLIFKEILQEEPEHPKVLEDNLVNFSLVMDKMWLHAV